MSKPVRGFQINTVLDRLALDMLGVLRECLTVAPLAMDRLHLAILLTLSRKVYVENLLYRDFRRVGDTQWYSYTLPDGARARIHEQGIVYLDKVLARRLRLARLLKHEPGNMHHLLCSLCRYGPPGRGWETVEIRRDHTLQASAEAPDFRSPLAGALAAQRERLGDGYGEDSKRRRAEYGPLWLVRGASHAEVPEEMSLFDVIEAAPVPLQPAFAEDHQLQRMLARVLDALNERYMLLRACGLDPEEWHDRDEPSIARLREMKQLRKPAEELLRLGIESDNDQAYRRAFDELKGRDRQFAGCATFDEFAATGQGLAVLRYASLSLDDPLGSDDEDETRARHETIADPEADVEDTYLRHREAEQWIQTLIEDRPDLFDDVMVYFFTEVIGHGRPIRGGSNDPGLVRDAAFQRLVEADPSLSVLDAGELAEQLYLRAEAIIKQGLRRQAYPE